MIVKRGYEKEVLPQLIDHSLSASGADWLDLRPTNTGAESFKILRRCLEEKAGILLIGKQSECPVVMLPDTWQSYLTQKSKNFRKKMKEFERVCRRDLDFHFRLCREKEDTQECFDELIKLHRRRWGRQSEAFQSATYLDFHRKVVKLFQHKGWLRLFIIHDGRKPIGAIYCYFYGGRYYYYQSGRDVGYEKYRIGLVLINKAIAHAISEGALVFDFLTGREPYKFRWADSMQVNVRLRYYSRWRDYLLARLINFESRFRWIASRLLSAIYNRRRSN